MSGRTSEKIKRMITTKAEQSWGSGHSGDFYGHNLLFLNLEEGNIYVHCIILLCVCVYLFNICFLGTSLVVWCLRLCVFPMQGMWVPSLFGEPRSHLPGGMAKKKKKVFCVIYFAINIRQKEKKKKKKLWNATQLLKNEADICPDMGRSPRHTD